MNDQPCTSLRRVDGCFNGKLLAILVLMVQGFMHIAYLSQQLSTEYFHDDEKSHQNEEKGFVRPKVRFGHIHMAKTAGTELNGMLASRFDGICGNKGYSFDYFQHNERVRSQNKTWTNGKIIGDSVSISSRRYNRGRVPDSLMQERGFEECDYVSHETDHGFWATLGSNETPLEIHVPCREPIDHLLSMCNQKHKTFDCKGDKEALTAQVKTCNVFVGMRFDSALESIPNLSLKCFPALPVERYIRYMSDFLQERRNRVDHVHRDTNVPRNRTIECLHSNETAAAAVREILKEQFDYYRFCNDCLGSTKALYTQ